VEVEARAGKNSFPPTPFLFARPSEFFSEISVRIFSKKSSDFVQETQPRKAASPPRGKPIEASPVMSEANFTGPKKHVLRLSFAMSE